MLFGSADRNSRRLSRTLSPGPPETRPERQPARRPQVYASESRHTYSDPTSATSLLGPRWAPREGAQWSQTGIYGIRSTLAPPHRRAGGGLPKLRVQQPVLAYQSAYQRRRTAAVKGAHRCVQAGGGPRPAPFGRSRSRRFCRGGATSWTAGVTAGRSKTVARHGLVRGAAARTARRAPGHGCARDSRPGQVGSRGRR